MSKRKRTREYNGREITYMIEFHDLQSISLYYPGRYGIKIYLENYKNLSEKKTAHIMVDLFYKLLDSSIEEIQNILSIKFENDDILSSLGEKIYEVSIKYSEEQHNTKNEIDKNININTNTNTKIKEKNIIYEYPDKWNEIMKLYYLRNITKIKAIEILNIKQHKFNKLLKQYKKELEEKK